MPQNGPILASFWKPETCDQTVLPDRLDLIGQKLVKNAKIENFKCDIWSNFQTMWIYLYDKNWTFTIVCIVGHDHHQ